MQLYTKSVRVRLYLISAIAMGQIISGRHRTHTALCDSFPQQHQVQIQQVYTGMNIMDCWPRFSAHSDCTLHVLLLASPAVCLCPGWKELEQLYNLVGHVTLTVDRHNDDYICNHVSPCWPPVKGTQCSCAAY